MQVAQNNEADDDTAESMAGRQDYTDVSWVPLL